MKNNVLIINSSLDLYGSNRILALIMKFLQKRYNLILLLPSDEGPFVNFLKDSGVHFQLLVNKNIPVIQRKVFLPKAIFIAFKQMISFYFFINKQNKIMNFDFVYLNTLSIVLCTPVLFYSNFKTITHVHEILESPKIVAKFLNFICLRFSTHVIAVSNAVRRNLEINLNKFAFKIHVIHNGITDLLDLSYQSDNKEKIIITLIARIKPEKGIWFFLDALKLITNKNAVSIRIIGGPPPFGEFLMEQLAYDIEKHEVDIQLINFTNNVNSYLNSTDILVVPSLMKDPFPTTVLEGMSCNKAVIATNTGGAVEAIENGVSGILIESTDSRNFAKSMDFLIENKEIRMKYGNQARMRYLADFTVHSFENRLEIFFKSI